MAYQHGITVLEQATSLTAPIKGDSAIQVVFGTAPINLAEDPYSATNVPIIAYSYAEAVKQLGFSYDFKKYTLCQSIYASFQLYLRERSGPQEAQEAERCIDCPGGKYAGNRSG